MKGVTTRSTPLEERRRVAEFTTPGKRRRRNTDAPGSPAPTSDKFGFDHDIGALIPARHGVRVGSAELQLPRDREWWVVCTSSWSMRTQEYLTRFWNSSGRTTHWQPQRACR